MTTILLARGNGYAGDTTFDDYEVLAEPHALVRGAEHNPAQKPIAQSIGEPPQTTEMLRLVGLLRLHL